MGQENILVGLATLAVRNPNDALAKWTTEDRHQGTYSVKLIKGGSGNAGGTGIKFCPPDITLGTWDTLVNTEDNYEVYYRNQKTTKTRNWVQWGFRFDDPDTNAHAEITVFPYHSIAGDNIWTLCDLGAISSAPPAASYGENEDGTRVNFWETLKALDTIKAAIGEACVVSAEGSADDWILSWVKINLWEPEPARYSYIDEIKVHGIAYSLEPDGDLPGLELSSPYIDVGYTEDGVTLDQAVDTTDIRVEEEVYPVGRKISTASLAITCNMAEASLANMEIALAGSVLDGNILTLGDGVLKEMSIRLTGLTPAGKIRAYYFPRVTAAGSVGMSFRRADKTIVPLTLQALKPASGPIGTYVDNVA